MKRIDTGFEGLFVIEPKVFGDHRGFFFESYNQKIFRELGINHIFVQDNESLSSYGTLRGLHFQEGEFSQAKLVRVVKGKVLDVVVDVRRDSKTYGKSFSCELSEENKKVMMIPRGFAHGFVVLSETSVFQYKCDNFYSPANEAGIHYADPDLGIDWKVPADKILMSDKDKLLPNLREMKALGRLIDFTIMGDERGNLISLEENINIPFDVKRVYYIFDNIPGVERGFHAHKNLKQVVVCLHGSCKFVLDDGKTKEEVILNNKAKGLFISEFIWREMKEFSPGAVLMVVASEHYNENDYIRNYDDFKKMSRSKEG